MSINRAELDEIAHSGGKVTFEVTVSPDGEMSYTVQWSHSRPTPASIYAVYAIPQGFAVSDYHIGGIGTPVKPPPIPNCYPVFLSSDSTSLFGRQCPACNGYWRSGGLDYMCPYCAVESEQFFQFLTEAQQLYVQQYCELLRNALQTGKEGTHTIDMDAVADAAGKNHSKPPFYYAEERQQNLFTCSACRRVTDVLGTYAYCGVCGTRNDLTELEKTIKRIRDSIQRGSKYEGCVKDTVSAFDSFAGHLATELRKRVPLTKARINKIDRTLYHNLDTAATIFREMFDIDILKGLNDEDTSFVRLMFHRRHVYEHYGGEADEKYIKDSGDKVRLKQALRETQESAHRTANLVLRIAKNLHNGFHDIFPPRETAV